ncbi:type VII secretion target [Saccharomonospora viridis]|jgi:hypothetical protein|uniref:Excreted virulence factor EspC, type VII ESX diderm n=1 Tax=Saccharomonospora viridis (strain ATCC 15386 / DSM 43017 / JCM 3036 / CCUG 5913 / NBRC 12207 / NCIMB 9602 / P101) TaxID=471857 RepID=C7MTJ1_SACVD|nr:type VII secretion target [Saccharomonospora viridis]ACU95461.1 hypothetical protein Svir_03840 [Saccharomonospora viridis DSM 43017]
MSGFTVDSDELRRYGDKLAGHKDTAGQIASLLDQADVGDKSWGVVGLIVKEQYTELLSDLRETFTMLQEGLQSGSDKFKAAADGYQQNEEAMKQLLDGLKIEIDRG